MLSLSRSMFILTLIVPAVFAVLWFAMTIYVVAFRLREMKPAAMFTVVFVVCAIGSQLVYWLAGKPLCEVRGSRFEFGSHLEADMLLFVLCSSGKQRISRRSLSGDVLGDGRHGRAVLLLDGNHGGPVSNVRARVEVRQLARR